MKRRHLKTYERLKSYGYSPFIALRIVIDAQRGDDYAIQHIKIVYGRFWLRGRV